uniref:Truncated nef protein n=1 Tax=Simian immunodeficiency virus TaxID=11723 RepID=G0WVJ9_SIV|nr:truncated nef protein [Simian immunodeficiency virus]
MGGAISMRRSGLPGDLRQRLLRARGETCGRLLEEEEDGYSQPPGELDKGLSSLSCEGQVSFYKRKGGTGRDLLLDTQKSLEASQACQRKRLEEG